MTLTLTADIDETAQEMTVTGTVPDSIEAHDYRFQLSGSDEVMEIVGFGPVDPPRTWPVNRNRWLIHRHALGTTATAHTNGATVQAVVDEFVAGDDEVAPDPIAALATLPTQDEKDALDASPNALNAGNPVASQADLGAVSTPILAAVLDAGNDTNGRDITGTSEYAIQGQNGAEIRFIGNGRLDFRANGSTSAGVSVMPDGDLEAGSGAFSVDGTTGFTNTADLEVGGRLHTSNGSLDFAADGSTGAILPGELGFFGATPTAQPVVPLSDPTVQNVIDALVALGLLTQSD